MMCTIKKDYTQEDGKTIITPAKEEGNYEINLNSRPQKNICYSNGATANIFAGHTATY